MSKRENWQVHVSGMGGEVYTIDVAKNSEEFLSTTVIWFRRLLQKKWSDVCSGTADLRLLYAGRWLVDELSNGKKATLRDYIIRNNSTIHTVLRPIPEKKESQGVARSREGVDVLKVRKELPEPPVVEKVHNMFDVSLKFTTQGDDLGISYKDDQPRITMSCGHAVDANSLTAWCMCLIKQQEYEFYCPAIIGTTKQQCKKVWSYEEVRRVAHLTAKEQQFFETKLSEHAACMYFDLKECPGCRSMVERCDLDSLRVHCPICTEIKKRNFDFCWHCNHEWTEPTTYSMFQKCGNVDCVHPDLQAIQRAPTIIIGGRRVPSRRACPTCGRVQEHNQEGCKYIICCRCKKEYCFLCLKMKDICLHSAAAGYWAHCEPKEGGYRRTRCRESGAQQRRRKRGGAGGCSPPKM